MVLDRLLRTDRRAELATLGHVVDGQVEHPPAQSDELGRHPERSPVEGTFGVEGGPEFAFGLPRPQGHHAATGVHGVG